MVLISYCTATVVDFSKALLQAAVRVACEQAIHLGWSRDVAREQHAKGDASAFSGGSLRSP